MSDISMCAQTSCVKRKDCYRYRAVGNPTYQAYSVFNLCVDDHADFWPVNEGDKVRTLEQADEDNQRGDL